MGVYEDFDDVVLSNYLKQGDQLAFEILFRRYFKIIVCYVNTFLRDYDASKELTQELFLSVWMNHERFNFCPSFKAYLIKAAKNRSLNWILKKKKQRETLNHQSLEPIVDFRSEMEIMEDRERIFDAVDNLPEPSKHYFKLSRFREMTYPEIAIEMNVSVKNVEYHISKAIRILREAILVMLLIFFY